MQIAQSVGRSTAAHQSNQGAARVCGTHHIVNAVLYSCAVSTVPVGHSGIDTVRTGKSGEEETSEVDAEKKNGNDKRNIKT